MYKGCYIEQINWNGHSQDIYLEQPMKDEQI